MSPLGIQKGLEDFKKSKNRKRRRHAKAKIIDATLDSEAEQMQDEGHEMSQQDNDYEK